MIARSALVVALLSGLAWSSHTADARPHPGEEHEGCGKAAALQARFEAGLPPFEEDGPGFSPREAMTDTDVLNNAIDLEIFPSTASITGSNTFTIRSTVAGLTQFTFMLRQNFTVTEVLFNGTTVLGTPAMPDPNGSYRRIVTLPRPIALNETFTLKVSYTGPAVSRGFGSINFTTQNGQPLVFTLSQPFYAGTWWPAKDGDVLQPGDNSDKATFDIWVTAPTGLRTAANGLLQGIDSLPNNRTRYRYRTNYLMPSYLACFSTTNYNTWTRTYSYPLPGGGTGTMPVEFFLYPASDTPNNRAAWERCIDMLSAFRPLFGEYPFINEKYGMYQFAFGGGMEHQTMTGQGTFNESVTAHELGHQWWGDSVTCRTWNDIWLNEGFATYSQALWEQFKPGGSLAGLHSFMASNRPSTTSGSVYRYDTSSVNSIFNSSMVYDKGAWVVQALRKAFRTDQAFFNALQSYRAVYEGSAATTGGLSAVLSASLGRDLDPFFTAWVYGEGAPAFTTGWQRLSLNGRDYLKLRIRQTQNAALPTFPSPLDIVVTSGGSNTYQVWSEARTQHFVIPLASIGTISSVAVDPENWILAGSKTSEAFVAGPAKLLEMTPAPGSTSSASNPVSAVRLTFSENIAAATAGQFEVARNGQLVAFSYAYSAATQTATLSLAQPLSPGLYTVTARDTILTNGSALDGEFTGSLPSGNGLPGGAFSASFSVEPCPADFNGDGFADFFDFDDFVTCFESGTCPDGASADFNNDGFADFFDFDDFVTAFEAGC